MILTLLVVAQLNGRGDLQQTVNVQRTAPVSLVQSTQNPQNKAKQLTNAPVRSECGLSPCISVKTIQNMVNVHGLYKSGAIK